MESNVAESLIARYREKLERNENQGELLTPVERAVSRMCEAFNEHTKEGGRPGVALMHVYYCISCAGAFSSQEREEILRKVRDQCVEKGLLDADESEMIRAANMGNPVDTDDLSAYSDDSNNGKLFASRLAMGESFLAAERARPRLVDDFYNDLCVNLKAGHSADEILVAIDDSIDGTLASFLDDNHYIIKLMATIKTDVRERAYANGILPRPPGAKPVSDGAPAVQAPKRKGFFARLFG